MSAAPSQRQFSLTNGLHSGYSHLCFQSNIRTFNFLNRGLLPLLQCQLCVSNCVYSEVSNANLPLEEWVPLAACKPSVGDTRRSQIHVCDRPICHLLTVGPAETGWSGSYYYYYLLNQVGVAPKVIHNVVQMTIFVPE